MYIFQAKSRQQHPGLTPFLGPGPQAARPLGAAPAVGGRSRCPGAGRGPGQPHGAALGGPGEAREQPAGRRREGAVRAGRAGRRASCQRRPRGCGARAPPGRGLARPRSGSRRPPPPRRPRRREGAGGPGRACGCAPGSGAERPPRSPSETKANGNPAGRPRAHRAPPRAAPPPGPPSSGRGRDGGEARAGGGAGEGRPGPDSPHEFSCPANPRWLSIQHGGCWGSNLYPLTRPPPWPRRRSARPPAPRGGGSAAAPPATARPGPAEALRATAREGRRRKEQRGSLGCAPSASRGRRGPALGAGPAGRGAGGWRRPGTPCAGSEPAPWGERAGAAPGREGEQGQGEQGLPGPPRSPAGECGHLPREDALPWEAPQPPEGVSRPPGPRSVSSLGAAERARNGLAWPQGCVLSCGSGTTRPWGKWRESSCFLCRVMAVERQVVLSTLCVNKVEKHFQGDTSGLLKLSTLKTCAL